jgi:hypothetical protein
MITKLNQILKNENIGSASPTAARVTVQEVLESDAAKLKQIINAFGGKEGWLCFTDKVVIINEQNTLQVDGIILSGELVCGSKSLHIRQSEKGWSCYTIERQDHSNDQLMIEETFLSIPGRGNCKLKYEIYWKLLPDSTAKHGMFQPYVSRFAGFAASASKKQEVKS